MNYKTTEFKNTKQEVSFGVVPTIITILSLVGVVAWCALSI